MTPPEARKYPQFDGLRALAGALTLYHHWIVDLATSPKFDHWIFSPLRLPIGGFGVIIFFVLSGFLITDILREYWGAPERTFVLRRFYIRRALRIFPIFFLTIAVAVYFDLPPFRDSLWWHVLYASNLYIFMQQEWIGSASHLWTLAVEEQFYLFWPILLLFFRASFRTVCLSVILSGAVAQAIALIWFPKVQFVALLPVFSMGALAAGALLTEGGEVRALLRRAAWPIAVLWLAVIVATMTGGSTPLLEMGGYYGALAGAILLVHFASHGISGWFGSLLENPYVRSIGIVSYGIYLYHNFSDSIVTGIFGPVGTELRLLLLVVVTLTLAYASWFLIELPINRLKRHFPYCPEPVRDGPGVALPEPRPSP